MKYEIGDVVECIDDADFPESNFFPNGPVVKGQRYIVEGTTNNKTLGLILVDKPGFDADCDPIGWKASRFKKVEESNKN